MKTFLRKNFKSVRKYFNWDVHSHFSFSNSWLDSRDFTIEDHFPDFERIQSKYFYMKMNEASHKNFVCNELIEECNIDKSSFYLQGFERKYVVTMDMKILKKHGLIHPDSTVATITDSLLSYLEPFPFDRKQLSCFDLQQQSSTPVTIKSIRDAVEKQYLAWKYNVNMQQINGILIRLQPCLYPCRSLRNLKKNIAILDMISLFKNKNLSQKIYVINQHPFSIPLVLSFDKLFSTLSWDVFSQSGYRVLQTPFKQIHFIIEILQNKGFTVKQIQEGFPYLFLSVEAFINRMNIILSRPALSQYEKHDQFLHLLHYTTVHFMNLENMSFDSLEELKITADLISSKMKLRRTPRITISSIKYQVSNYFAIGKEHLDIIKRHPKFSMISEQQLSQTLKFLKDSKFSKTEVLESIIIILYPKRVITKALKKITEEADVLSKVGLVNGCVSEETNFFKPGTKSRRKTLQLCLYYIEKQFNFSWDGVLNLSIKQFDKEEES